MSHTPHQAMCVTCYDKKELKEYYQQIKQLGLRLTEIYASEANGYHSFFIIPCGSKAGWPTQVDHQAKLQEAKKIISRFDYEDGSNGLNFAIAIYGEDEG